MNELQDPISFISYFPLWKTLIDLRMNRGQLCAKAHLSRATVTKMGKNKPVSLDVIARICLSLHVPVEQVIEVRSAPEGDIFCPRP